MEPIKQVFGIDISKDTFVCTAGTITAGQRSDIGPHRTFQNNTSGFKSFLGFAHKQRLDKVPQSFLMEATGVYYEALAYFLKEQGCAVIVVLPNKARYFARTLENKSKTDALDARILTQMGLEKRFKEWQPPSQLMKTLKSLTREHLSIKELRTDAKNRFHAKSHAFQPTRDTLKRLKAQIALYDRQLKQIEESIQDLLKSQPEIWQKAQNIMSIKGVGLMTFARVIAETNAFALIHNAKQLASYAGLDIALKESGKYKGKTKISKKGNRYLRQAVYMPAISAISSNEQMKTFYERLLNNGKPKKAAIVAVARKLLLLIYHIWNNNTAYDPAF